MRELKTGGRDYTLSETERENILSKTAGIYRKGIAVRFAKWFFYLSAFFFGVLPDLFFELNGVFDFVRLSVGFCCFAFVVVWQTSRWIKAVKIKRKLSTLDDSTLAVVFREVKNSVETKSERWKSYIITTLLLLIVTAGFDFLSFGVLAPFFMGESSGVLYVCLGVSKLCIIMERAYEAKTQTDFYITSCYLF